MKNTLTKRGLTGNSGFIGNIHISAPYDSNGRVFVETEDIGWVRVPKNTAKRHKLTVIKCYVCENPAVRLDHLWPYHTEMTACKDHLDWHHDWECQDIRSIGNLCRVVDGKLVVFKAVMA